jgi:hypothetical protein
LQGFMNAIARIVRVLYCLCYPFHQLPVWRNYDPVNTLTSWNVPGEPATVQTQPVRTYWAATPGATLPRTVALESDIKSPTA